MAVDTEAQSGEGIAKISKWQESSRKKEGSGEGKGDEEEVKEVTMLARGFGSQGGLGSPWEGREAPESP